MTELRPLQGVFDVLNKSIVRLAIPVAASTLLLTGCGGGGSDTIKIAYQGPLSGDNVGLGQNMERGVQLAIDEANESGQFDFELEYFAADDGGVEGQSTAAAQSAIDDSGVVAVIGPAFSGPAHVAGPLYGAAGLAAVSTSATDPALTQQEEPFGTFLRAVPNDNAQGAAMAEFLAGQEGVDSVMVIDDTSPYGVGLADVAEADLSAAGLDVRRQKVPDDTVDYSGAARTVVDSGVDALIYAGYYADLAPFATRLDEAGYEGMGISGDGSNDDELINLADEAVEGWYLTCPCTDATQNEATQEFASRYEGAYGDPPGAYSAESYDAANMIIQAISELGGDPSREELYEALAGVEYEGLTKTFAFDETGEFANETIFFYQVDGGSIGYLGETSELVGG